ncbi:hypothetical protein SVA_3440 [Sulfurifustis variabilis]|uniref:Blue (type 1) copper domain-containing protein n=1 Tax=Sulfurifustis variabilis TaxID=1675686 RepID=A0A1C7AFB5_9GAMM|nr:cupredoxin family protein [Sulfurifustis variabilis]BAU49976.1 hypothetical protein SVA_3440 [Sulfurifustis variabilis]
MKKAFAVLLLGALPWAAHAAGNHSGDHDKSHTRDGGQHMDHRHHGGHDTHTGGSMHGAGIGRPGDPAKVSRTIEVTMGDDMRFTPDRIKVKAGETIRFFVRNTGRMQHEMVLGTMGELKEHAAMMRAQPHMTHADPNMTSVRPGRLGGMVWRFDAAGTVHFACLVPGHLEAGMLGQVEVE